MTDDAHRTSSAHRRLVLGGITLGLMTMLLTSVAYRLGDHPLTRPSTAPATSPEASPAMPPAASRPGESSAIAPDQADTINAMQKLRANPDDVDTLLELAELFMRRGSPDNAQEFINRALVAAPGDARPSYYQALLDAEQGRFSEAADAMTRSLRLQDNPSVRYSLAVVYRYHLHDEAKAREQLDAALRHPALNEELRGLIEQEMARDL
ncbi:MAG: tetratricopeptide repeat protein [Desulfovibrionaceae bacterium]|nr:tetratricopeptide repeat protein [Desulfovibrionaceae bacterium]